MELCGVLRLLLGGAHAIFDMLGSSCYNYRQQHARYWVPMCAGHSLDETPMIGPLLYVAWLVLMLLLDVG